MPPGPVRVVVDRRFLLGENPLWDDRRGELFWTDIDAGELWRLNPAGGRAERCYEGETVGGFTLQDDGSLLLFRVRDIATFDPDSGAQARTIAPFEEANAARFNDVLAAPDGTVYAGTIAARTGSGGLYHVGLDAAVRRLWLGTDVSNGMAIGETGEALLWTCSTSRRILRYRRDPLTNDLADERQIYRTNPEEGVPDGLTLDQQGHIWSARWEGSAVIRHTPKGKPVSTLSVPTERVTSVAFGGPDLGTLFVTTSEGPLYAADVGVRGVPERRSLIRVSRQPE